MNDHGLGYALSSRLVYSVVYNLYQLIPFPTRVKNNQNTFLIMGIDKNYLLWTRLKKCMLNVMNYKYRSAKEWRKCKHVFPLKFKILDLK